MTQQHDLLFRALVDDPAWAVILIRDYLPEAIACRLSDELPVLLDGNFVDKTLTPSWTDRLFSVTLRGGGTILIYILLEHKAIPTLRRRFKCWATWSMSGNASSARTRR